MNNKTVRPPGRCKGYGSMRRISVHAAVALCAVGAMSAGIANATLVGDTVTVGHYAPDTTSTLSGATPPASFMVQAGTADVYTFYHSYPYGYRVNVEANSILVDFNYLHEATGTWGDSYTLITGGCSPFGCTDYTETIVPYNFNGLGVSDLDDSSGNALQGVVVDTNMAGWESSRLSFGSDFVQFDWKGLSFTSEFWNYDEFGEKSSLVTPATYFNATLDFGGTAAPIPEPEIYAMLGVGLGLMGWVGRRRKLQVVA